MTIRGDDRQKKPVITGDCIYQQCIIVLEKNGCSKLLKGEGLGLVFIVAEETRCGTQVC
jgi:hypothetical protein